MGKLNNKVAVVTGAARGIGRAIALAYGREGGSVVVASRTESSVARVVSEIEGTGGRAVGVTVDVGDRDAVYDMVARTVTRPIQATLPSTAATRSAKRLS